MPLNLAKRYPDLLELGHYNESQRRESLMRIFKRDISNNPSFKFRKKPIRPTKKEGEAPLQTLFRHLTQKDDKDEQGRKLGTRTFDIHRSRRLHWIKTRIEELKNEGVEVFSYTDRIDRKDVIRTYIFDTNQKYVVILEPQRNETDYYLLTAYFCNEDYGVKQIKKKLKKKLEMVY